MTEALFPCLSFFSFSFFTKQFIQLPRPIKENSLFCKVSARSTKSWSFRRDRKSTKKKGKRGVFARVASAAATPKYREYIIRAVYIQSLYARVCVSSYKCGVSVGAAQRTKVSTTGKTGG